MFGKIILLFLAGLFPGIRSLNYGIFSHGTDSIPGYEFTECEHDLEKIWSALSNGELWAMKILDSSTKFPSGILTGHLADYGNYDECWEVWDNLKTQYCQATIVLPFNTKDENNSTLDSPIAMRWSYCVPASCPPTILQAILQEVLQETKLNVTVNPSDCELTNQITATTEDYVGISIWGIFLGLAVVSTIYDVVVRKIDGQPNQWLVAFSIYTNGIRLLNTDVSKETMTSLSGLRFLSCCWVILGHRYFFTIISSLINVSDFFQELNKIQSQFFFQGVMAVDTFFLLSGMLNCYNLLKVLNKIKRFPVWMYYFHRYMRLTPALAAIVLMYATWFYLLGNGPVWRQTSTLWKQLCVDHWWSTLLYINNYNNPVTQCAGQSWYLAVDMQLYWLAPLILLPLWKRPKLGKAIIWLLLFASMLSQFVIAYIYEFRAPFVFLTNRMEEFEEVMKLIYVPTHTRATPYIVGILIGYYLYELKETGRQLKPSKKLVAVGWFLSTAICLSVFLGNYQFTRPVQDHPYNRWESSIYIALHRLAWSFGIGWVIVACVNKNGGIVNTILSWRAMVPLSRLTYCIFLCHMAIQQYQVGSARTTDYFQHFNQLHRFFGDVFLSIIAATALSLVFESPIMVLEKLAMRKPTKENLKGQSNSGFQHDSPDTNKTHEIQIIS